MRATKYNGRGGFRIDFLRLLLKENPHDETVPSLLTCAIRFAVRASNRRAGNHWNDHGKADVKSAGPLAFGPDGILFVGDSMGAQIVAIDTGDTAKAASGSVNVQGIDAKIAAALGTTADQISIRDLATNPVSKNVYISVHRGRGADAIAVILKLDSAGKLSEVKLDNVKYSAAKLPNPTTQGNQRTDTITEVQRVDARCWSPACRMRSSPRT